MHQVLEDEAMGFGRTGGADASIGTHESSLPKILSGTNAFKINNIQEAGPEGSGDQDVTMLLCVENAWMEFLRSRDENDRP
jgi:hypothetical protein